MNRLIAFMLTILLCLGTTISAFAGTNITLQINNEANARKISQDLYGVNLANADGGLNSNMVCNNSFENEELNGAWIFGDVKASVEKTDFMNENNRHYARVSVDTKGYITNTGYTQTIKNDAQSIKAEMGFKKGNSYYFSCFLKNIDFDGTISVYLDSKNNKENTVQLSTNNLSSASWKRFSTKLRAEASESGGVVIVLRGSGTILIDNVSLVDDSSFGFNQEQWQYSSMRSDLVDAISGLKPSYIRFGSAGEDVSYSWKDTIGPLESRKQTALDTNEIGYHEYFQLCDELYAHPIPIVGAGMANQGEAYELMCEAYDKIYMDEEQYFSYLVNEKGFSSANKSAMRERAEYIDSLGIKSVDDWQSYIDSIALTPDTNEFSNYAQDVLDLIEYANGDANRSYWGAMRRANGHEEPFNLEYIAIGDENWGEVYLRNFKALKKIINKKYPKIEVICCAGNSLDMKYLDQALNSINSAGLNALVDEHFSTEDVQLLDNNNRYDGYDRSSASVIVSSLGARDNSLFSAIEKSSFALGVERNGDIVKMLSSTPTISYVDNEDVETSLIWYDSQGVVLTPSYYANMLFANNYGKEALSASLIGAEGKQIYQSITVDKKGQELYIKLVNAENKRAKITINLEGFKDITAVSCQSISGAKGDENSFKNEAITPTQKDLSFEQNGLNVVIDGCSASVIRIAYGDNIGNGFYLIPQTVNTKTKTSGKDIVVLLSVVIFVFLLSSFIGYMLYTRLVLKKQGKPYKLFGKKKDNEE